MEWLVNEYRWVDPRSRAMEGHHDGSPHHSLEETQAGHGPSSRDPKVCPQNACKSIGSLEINKKLARVMPSSPSLVWAPPDNPSMAVVYSEATLNRLLIPHDSPEDEVKFAVAKALTFCSSADSHSLGSFEPEA